MSLIDTERKGTDCLGPAKMPQQALALAAKPQDL